MLSRLSLWVCHLCICSKFQTGMYWLLILFCKYQLTDLILTFHHTVWITDWFNLLHVLLQFVQNHFNFHFQSSIGWDSQIGMSDTISRRLNESLEKWNKSHISRFSSGKKNHFQTLKSAILSFSINHEENFDELFE